MRTSRRLLTALALAGIFGLSTAAQALDRHVWIVNNSNRTMISFYASNVGSDSWEEDILGIGMLSPGERVRVNINDGSGYCKFDLKAVMRGGISVTRRNFNVCDEEAWNVVD